MADIDRTPPAPTQKLSRLAEAILEATDSLHRIGTMDGETHAKITRRHFGKPTGAALALLNVIRRKGIEVVL